VVDDQIYFNKQKMNIFINIYMRFKNLFILFDRRLDRGISFFFKNYGKTKFMISMSNRLQVLGIEKLFSKGPKAFIYFFLFYLVRDTILYIVIPIYFAKVTTN
jgi:hypothetical protein